MIKIHSGFSRSNGSIVVNHFYIIQSKLSEQKLHGLFVRIFYIVLIFFFAVSIGCRKKKIGIDISTGKQHIVYIISIILEVQFINFRAQFLEKYFGKGSRIIIAIINIKIGQFDTVECQLHGFFLIE